MKIGIAQIAIQGDVEARKLTSGVLSTKELSRPPLSHPYARRSRFVSLNPYIINRQTGELQNSLKLEFSSGSDFEQVRLFFTSPHAVVLTRGGTKYMIDRLFWQELGRRVEPTWLRAQKRVLALKA